MGWFRRLFSRRKPAQGEVGDTELVLGLKEDHRELLLLYSHVATAVDMVVTTASLTSSALSDPVLSATCAGRTSTSTAFWRIGSRPIATKPG